MLRSDLRKKEVCSKSGICVSLPPGPQFVLTGPALNFHFPAPALNLFLPALALNLCLPVLRFTVKVCYSCSVYIHNLSIYLYILAP